MDSQQVFADFLTCPWRQLHLLPLIFMDYLIQSLHYSLSYEAFFFNLEKQTDP